jgi:hypothetical protein
VLPLIRSLNRFGIVNRVKIDRLSTSDRTASHHRTCATQVEAHTIGFIESVQMVRLGCSCSHIRRADSALDGCEARAQSQRYEESPFKIHVLNSRHILCRGVQPYDTFSKHCFGEMTMKRWSSTARCSPYYGGPRQSASFSQSAK